MGSASGGGTASVTAATTNSLSNKLEVVEGGSRFTASRHFFESNFDRWLPILVQIFIFTVHTLFFVSSLIDGGCARVLQGCSWVSLRASLRARFPGLLQGAVDWALAAQCVLCRVWCARRNLL